MIISYKPDHQLGEFFRQFNKQEDNKPFVFNIITIAATSVQVRWNWRWNAKIKLKKSFIYANDIFFKIIL